MIRSEAPPSPQHYYILDDVRVGSILDIDFLGGHQQNDWLRILFPNSVGMIPSVGREGYSSFKRCIQKKKKKKLSTYVHKSGDEIMKLPPPPAVPPCPLCSNIILSLSLSLFPSTFIFLVFQHSLLNF